MVQTKEGFWFPHQSTCFDGAAVLLLQLQLYPPPCLHSLCTSRKAPTSDLLMSNLSSTLMSLLRLIDAKWICCRTCCRIIQAAALQLIDPQTLRMRWWVWVELGEPLEKLATEAAVVRLCILWARACRGASTCWPVRTSPGLTLEHLIAFYLCMRQMRCARTSSHSLCLSLTYTDTCSSSSSSSSSAAAAFSQRFSLLLVSLQRGMALYLG